MTDGPDDLVQPALHSVLTGDAIDQDHDQEGRRLAGRRSGGGVSLNDAGDPGGTRALGKVHHGLRTVYTRPGTGTWTHGRLALESAGAAPVTPLWTAPFRILARISVLQRRVPRYSTCSPPCSNVALRCCNVPVPLWLFHRRRRRRLLHNSHLAHHYHDHYHDHSAISTTHTLFSHALPGLTLTLNLPDTSSSASNGPLQPYSVLRTQQKEPAPKRSLAICLGMRTRAQADLGVM